MLSDIFWHVVIFGAVAAVVWYLAANTVRNLQARGIVTGFGYLAHVSRLPISESLIALRPGIDSYATALLVGILNTLKVSLVAIVLATLLGAFVGLGRLSAHPILSRLCAAYVGLFRNIPVLVHLIFWYQLSHQLPGPRQALAPLPGVFLSNRGLRLPGFGWDGVDVPVLRGFDFQGGIALSPEFLALLIGLVTYTAAFIAETIRGGVLAVPAGQREAARALGLREGRIVRLIVLPQALRMIVPPLTGEYLGLIKNSSLAVAIGYQDFVAISNSILSETGQAIEGVALIMAAYLTVSLSVSLLMHGFNARFRLVER